MNTIDLSPFFQTKIQAADFSSRVATLAEKIYETDFNLEKALMDQFGLKKKDGFMTLLRDNKIASESNTALKQFLTQLQETIAALPVLSLTIAFEPTEKTMKALSEWFLINSNRQVLFAVTVDSRIIAGASISFNGKDQDFSIKAKFDQIVQEGLTKKTQETKV